MRHVILASWLAVLVLGAGCLRYISTPAHIPIAGKMPAWRDDGVVAFGADPYVEKSRQKEVFDANLDEAGALAVQIFLNNQGEHGLLVRYSEFRLQLPNRDEVLSVGSDRFAAKVEDSGSIFGGGFAAEQARSDRRADYRGKVFKDLALRKGDTAHGFVYFIFPGGTPAFTQATLTVRCVDMEEGTIIRVELPLSGLKIKGVPPWRGGGYNTFEDSSR